MNVHQTVLDPFLIVAPARDLASCFSAAKPLAKILAHPAPAGPPFGDFVPEKNMGHLNTQKDKIRTTLRCSVGNWANDP